MAPMTAAERAAFVAGIEQKFGWDEASAHWTRHTTAETRAEDREQWLIDVAARLMLRPADPDAPHRWIPGGLYEACGICERDPRNNVHLDEQHRIERPVQDSEYRVSALGALVTVSLIGSTSLVAAHGLTVLPSSEAPRADDDPEQRLLDRARRLAADPFGEY